MLNAQLLKVIRPKTKSRTSESRKRAAEESKPPTKRTRLPEIVSMPVLDAQDSPMGETTEPSQEEFSTPTELNTPGEATATPTSLGEVDLSGPPSPYEEPEPRKQFRWGKAEVKTFKPDKQQNTQKKKSGATSPTGLRAEDPTGTNKGRVPTRIVANALLQPYAYTKHAASPKGDKIPSVAKAIDEVSKLPTKVALGTNREEEIENIVTSWWEDTRDLPLPENRPEEFCKLGLPEKATDTEGNAGYQILRHVRPITGCDLAPKQTNKYGLPLQGSPQIKIKDLRETQRYTLLYLRYLADVIRRALGLGEDDKIFNIEHTQLWTDREGKVVQIDLAFRKRPMALFVLFNTNFLVPMTVVDDPWVDIAPPRVIPRVYVWSPYRQPTGTLRSRTVQVSSPQLRGVTVDQAAVILGNLVTQRGWDGSAAIARIRKGARDETPADNNIREVLFLVSHDQYLAELLIKDKLLDFGFPTRKGLLPSAADKQALSLREVAVIDYSQQLFVGHRKRIVSAITQKLSEVATQHKQPPYGEDAYLVFEKHLGTPRWAPSDSTVESLLQWKRNSNDTVNFYAILTESAYDLLVAAGSSITVDVHLQDDKDTGDKVFIPVKVEVGRWSLMGTKSRNKQAATPHHQRQEGTTDEKKLRATSEAAIHNVQRTTEECLRQVQQATAQAPPTSSTTPETKSLLSHIGHELELLNQKAAAAAASTEAIEAVAAKRHTDITSGIRNFHTTYESTGQAMVDTLVSLTNRLTKAPEEDKQEASSEGGLKRWTAKGADTSSKEEGSTQPSLREKLQYVTTDTPEVRKAKYDKFMADRAAESGDTPYGGIPYRGGPAPGEGRPGRSTGLGVKKKAIAKIPRKQNKPAEPPAKRARGQGPPADIPTGVPASGQLTTRRTTRQSAKTSMSSGDTP
ncbi:hypothetical protein CYMTET_48685 [Cymbomonas tetramitiformis]|uniref:Uncharacterized protein n=1 Tax=Cymbomonas tetramitiformis TaxID=36881 RepID=A0AAE0EVB4_9CHLO|nr:hypothetical protein CYMTET_48685 [Cymbomonas tetramitiformis]